jgi:hypothetical protein
MLPPGTTRGVSNEFLGTHATVSLDDGVLLAVIPDPGKPDPGKPDPGKDV